MSHDLDALARLLADGVMSSLREQGRLSKPGPSRDMSGRPIGVAEGPASPAGGPVTMQGLWHPEAPPPWDDARIAKGEVPIGVSARHCHVTDAAMAVLFGPGAKLRFSKPLMQRGEFAAEEKVAVRGPKGTIDGIRILGPTRNLVQVEVAVPDLRQIGINAPMRPSGVHDGSPGCALIGPFGEYKMTTGVIRANRHVHLSPKNAADLKVKENDLVVVHIPGPKPTTYYDVQVRVRDTFHAQLHLDTDDANAVEVRDGDLAVILSKR